MYPAIIRVMRENMEVIKAAMEMQDSSMSAGQAKILGVHLEGPFLNPAKCGSLNAMTFIEPSEKAFSELVEGFEHVVKIISIAPELNGATSLIKKISDMGVIVNMGHSDATFEEAAKGFQAGARGITHIFNAMRSFHHREPGIAGFGLLNDDIFIEVIADPFHLHRATLGLILKVKNPNRIVIVSDTVKESGTCHCGEGITNSYGYLVGGSMTIAESARRLVEMGYDEEMVMKFVTENPRGFLTGRR